MKKNLLNHVFIISAIVFTTTGCSNYYKAVISPVKTHFEKAKTIDSLDQNNGYIVLRNGPQSFHLAEPVFNNDVNSFSFILDTLSRYHQLYLTKGRKGKMKYRKEETDILVLNEAHIFIETDSTLTLGKNNISTDKIQRIEILKHDKRRSTNNHILVGIASTLVIVGIAALILASTLSFDTALGLGGH